MATPKKPAARKPAAKPTARPVSEAAVALSNPLSVSANYTTMTGVMSTPFAIRIAFGEAASGGNRFHSAVAMDHKVAAGLVEAIQTALEKHAGREAEYVGETFDALA
jgi:hypothetical protein